jgi:glycosyltransferase involved in cell wall biosynthesis
MPRLSAVVLTRNEERNLPNVLGSLRGWVDEVLVVDSASTDGTPGLARSLGARLVPFPETLHVDEARAAGLAAATGEWVLSIDADEMVTPALARRMREWMDSGGDAYLVPRLNYGMGRPFRATRWDPESNRSLALFRRDAVEATRHVHHFYHVRPGAKVVRPPYVAGEHIAHFSTLTTSHLLRKTDRYTGLEALDQPGMASRRPARVALSMLARFLSLYVANRGYRDGWRGLAVSASSAAYVAVAYAKACERAEGLDEEAVRRRYQEVADQILAGGAPPRAAAAPPPPG